MQARATPAFRSLLFKQLREAPPARSPARFVCRFGICAITQRNIHPSGASGGNYEALSGPA
eukprot:3982829-Alexandrium_andersonii.AAC.1